jgi:hypothetical protein
MSAKIEYPTKRQFDALEAACELFQGFKSNAQTIQVIDGRLHIWIVLKPQHNTCFSCGLPEWLRQFPVYTLVAFVRLATKFLGYEQVVIHGDSVIDPVSVRYAPEEWQKASTYVEDPQRMGYFCMKLPAIDGLAWDFPTERKLIPESKS